MKKIVQMIFTITTMVLVLVSCKKDITDLNVDKNAATEMDMAYLVSNGTLRIAGEYENTRANMLYSATMIQHTASTAGYFSGDRYLYSAQYSGAYMERHFTDVIRNFSQAIEKTKGVADLVNINSTAVILRAFDLHRMTDLYGDIPYTQAGYGLVDGDKNWFPKYESQKDVYAALVKDIKAARDKMSASAKSMGTQDFIYGGDIAKWKKFANSLLMRIAMRMSNVDATGAAAVYKEAQASGAFTSNADNAHIKFATGPQGINRNGLNDGYWNTYKYSRDCKISKTFINWMKANKDPRLMIVSGGIGSPDVASEWKTGVADQEGMPNGYTAANIAGALSTEKAAAYKALTSQANRVFSMLNLKYLDWEDPYLLITYGEVELMNAEAALKGWLTTSAETHFNNGVKAAIQNWTNFDASFSRTTSEIDTYIAGRGFAAASSTNKLKLIGEEYWAATYLNDIESWSNWRRTGYPVLKPTNDPNRFEANEIPRRLIYWENEISSNPANYKIAVDRMGGDKFMTKTWWDGGK
jgi:hypothetical protein